MKVSTVKVRVKTPFGAAVCSGAKEFLAIASAGAKKALIVSDDVVCKLYGNTLKKVIARDGLEIFTFVYQAAENGKSKYILDKLLILMTEINLTPEDCVISLGGSTAASLTAFASSIFKGGIPYINMPTTLLSMAGLCIKGDAGVDFLGRENLFRSVYYPKAVFCDVDFVKSLGEDSYSHGMAEIVRCAVAADKHTFIKMEEEDFTIEDGIVSALKIKAKKEAGKALFYPACKSLALGDTFARAAEIVSHYVVTRGEALAFGILLAAELSEMLGFSVGIKDRITDVFNKLGVNWEVNVKKDAVMDYILSDEKIWTNGIRLILPKRIGKCVCKKFDAEVIKDAYFGR